MMRHGAAIAQMEEMVGSQLTLPPGTENADFKPTAQRLTAAPHAILVDQSGVRFMNEARSYEQYCELMLKRGSVAQAVPSWAIMDSQYFAKYNVAAAGKGKIPRNYAESGYLKKADTLEALAALIKVDPAALKATVDRWNGFVDKGIDEDFSRGEAEYDKYLGDPFRSGKEKTLGRIDQGPFYAVEVVPGDVSTYGGIVTDVNSRVLKADGSPIEGLYATGVSTASPMGRVYPGAGASVGPSMAFGWIAAKHAAGLSNQAV
jgi:3-oxosteroid 1-dehydrogenase